MAKKKSTHESTQDRDGALTYLTRYVSLYPSRKAFCLAVGGISVQYLSQVLLGHRPVSVRMALQLSRLHGADLSLLRPDVYPIGTVIKIGNEKNG